MKRSANKAYCGQYYILNKQRLQLKARRYYLKNRDKVLKRNKAYRQTHKPSKAQRLKRNAANLLWMKRWRLKNLEAARLRSRKQYWKNPAAARASAKRSREKNREKHLAWRRKYFQRAKEALSDYYVRKVLGTTKSKATPELVKAKRVQLQLFRVIHGRIQRCQRNKLRLLA